MKNTILLSVLITVCIAITPEVSIANKKGVNKTIVSIKGEKFLINGVPTYKGRNWQGYPIEGLLMNSRMVQGIFDDLNPDSSSIYIILNSETFFGLYMKTIRAKQESIKK